MKLFRVQDVFATLDWLLKDNAIPLSAYDKVTAGLVSLDQLDEYSGMKANASWVYGTGDNVFCDHCGYGYKTIQQASTYCPNCGRIMFFDKLF
jgi:hypothetical protein